MTSKQILSGLAPSRTGMSCRLLFRRESCMLLAVNGWAEWYMGCCQLDPGGVSQCTHEFLRHAAHLQSQPAA